VPGIDGDGELLAMMLVAMYLTQAIVNRS